MIRKTLNQEATKRLADSDKSVIALEEEISALQSAARSATSPTRLDATQSPGGGIAFSPSPSPSADRAAILRLEDMVEMLLGDEPRPYPRSRDYDNCASGHVCPRHKVPRTIQILRIGRSIVMRMGVSKDARMLDCLHPTCKAGFCGVGTHHRWIKRG
jgi:hypothetical protein